MKYFLLSLITCFFLQNILAQEGMPSKQDTSWKKIYRETYTRVNDLVHTKLEVSFDFDKAYMNGKAWITAKPHFYPTDSLELDAKGMDIHKITRVEGKKDVPLKFDYDGMMLKIKLGKNIPGNQAYTIFIDYTAKPDEYKGKGSAAITSAKGLYFINPRGEVKDKPTQIWTQGETEATSVWCPTIDKPNQKTTQELSMTVPSKYVTLSNGKLVSQKNNANGTRTDTWKMDLPHAPYLFFMGVGDYAVIKDSYKGKEVSYYVEKEYGPVARKIFGNTPQMISYFSKILGIDYPWVKYAQIVGRDYVSGAMENTTATIHQESAQQDARELIDGNSWESTIAHELFHQWFGDLVTAESWSNLTLNESFANYSQVLWDEYKYGRDAGDAENFQDMQGYLQSQSDKKDLVRFYYDDKEAMFDAVSYNKGGRILHMLRNYVGDSAFFRALNLYLTTNKFKAAEAHHLRLAFEEVTGMDLNWYWNQWFFGAGHPKLTIDYIYDDAANNVKVIVKQTQSGDKVFRLPVALDIYNGGNKVRHKIWIDDKTDTFTISYTSKPDLINVDADKVLLAEKKDNKSFENFVHQYKYAKTYLDRREAIEYASRNQDNPNAVEILKNGLDDKYHGLRLFTLERIDFKRESIRNELQSQLVKLAKSDAKSTVRAKAISLLINYNNPEYKSIYVSGTNDSSYSVAGASLEALTKIDSVAAYNQAKKLIRMPAKGKLVEVLTRVLIKSGDESNFDVIAESFAKMPLSQAKFNLLQTFSDFISKIEDSEKVKTGVDMIVDFRDAIPDQYGLTPVVNNFLKGIISKKEAAKNVKSNKTPLQEQIDYIKSKIGVDKKGF